MEACLEAGVNYLDTANYEPKDEAHFEYSWQWAYHERFKEKGLTAILGCGFDPGVSAIFTAYEIQYLDIVDCNPEITEWLLLPTSIRKSIFGRSPKRTFL